MLNYLGTVEKAKYIGYILPAIKEFRQKMGVYELPTEAFTTAELPLAGDIQKIIDFAADLERRVGEFYSDEGLSEVDFDTLLYEGMREYNRWEKKHPFRPLHHAQNKLHEAKYEKERIEKQIALWEKKEAEFKADQPAK